ncbi:hypothetical protein VH13_08125 [Corynebacterium ulcerans]|uniref:DUF5979 domain-containing protein n=1 Tax=Corynebacterium ulcerans TaxID=65058 RepID=UPI000628520C|nr:DUF5979 domain-containing protein [Corynebacterium ulcerans]KKO85095.1 hypothetical protein VH13_08125 [Corynebacterium ulcerans]KKO85703.1 hypothetical protein VH15_10110 [Corynebacterium ulcerans]BDV25999.1 hypothetical protein CULTSU28_12470 [Corynebacterium ulcerans]
MMLTNVKHASVKRLTKNPWLSVLLALLLIASFTPLLAQSPSATAQETCTGGSWSNIKWKDDSPNIKDNKYVGPSGFAEVQFDWKASSTAKAGDTITFTLPNELKAVDTGTVALRDKKGEVVATGTWSGKTFVIKLTDFQNRNFDVEGSAFVSVAWDTSQNFDGSLNFTGCSAGSLPGKFEQREGGLFHDDSKIGEYVGYDKETGNYKIQWSVGINPKKHQNEHTGRRVLVTDKAPDGWQFTCNANDTNGYYPVFVSSFIQGANGQAQSIRHAIYDAAGQANGGNITGVTNLKNEAAQAGYNYTINCTPGEVSVEFPRGLYEQSGPVLTLTAVTKTKPTPGSIVKNKATIDGVEVEGHVRFPNAGGLGRGSKGGFTIEKNVVGTEEDKAKEYTFEYQCTSTNGDSKKKDTVSVKHGEFVHVSNLDKGLKCKIEEQTPEVGEGWKLTTSWVVIDKDNKVTSFNSTSSVDITIEDPSEEAVHLVATNKFEQKQTGSFTLKKKVEGVSTSEKFTFKWECTVNEGTKVSGESMLSDGAEVKIENLPLNSTCKITETPVELEGYTHSLSWLTNDEKSSTDNPFTVTPRDSSTKPPLVVTAVNKYTPVVPPVDPTSSPSTTTQTTEPTSSSSTTTQTTEPTSSSSTTTKTTHAIPPIIPIPIPIPVPTVLPPAPTVSPNVPTPTATPQAQPSSTAPQPERGKGVLARTGASVLWIALLAVLLVSLGGVMMYITNAKKKK